VAVRSVSTVVVRTGTGCLSVLSLIPPVTCLAFQGFISVGLVAYQKDILRCGDYAILLLTLLYTYVR